MGAYGKRRYDLRTKSSVGAVRRFWAVVFGLAAIYVNLLASVAAAPIILDTAQPRQFESAGVDTRVVVSWPKMVICSPNGTIIIDGVPQEPDHHASCAFCMPLLAGSIAAPEAVAFLEITRAIARAQAIPQFVNSLSKRLVQIAQPRAPPAA
ncbi:MAG: DUF2946 domain-containing protein [Hyphomicrobiaceae bacterium]